MLRHRWNGVQSENRPPLGDALVDLIHEPRIADALAHRLVRGLLAGLFADYGRLLRLLGSFPGVPGLSFQPVEFLKLQVTDVVEIPDRRFTPFLADAFQVVRDAWLGDGQMLADIGLAPALHVKRSDPTAPLKDCELLFSGRWHREPFCDSGHSL